MKHYSMTHRLVGRSGLTDLTTTTHGGWLVGHSGLAYFLHRSQGRGEILDSRTEDTTWGWGGEEEERIWGRGGMYLGKRRNVLGKRRNVFGEEKERFGEEEERIWGRGGTYLGKRRNVFREEEERISGKRRNVFGEEEERIWGRGGTCLRKRRNVFGEEEERV